MAREKLKNKTFFFLPRKASNDQLGPHLICVCDLCHALQNISFQKVGKEIFIRINPWIRVFYRFTLVLLSTEISHFQLEQNSTGLCLMQNKHLIKLTRHFKHFMYGEQLFI